jgi:IS605 OrfB family transposase
LIILEYKLKGKNEQYRALDEAIRTALFVRNKSVRYWLDNRGVGRTQLMRHNTQLRAEFEWCKKLNSHACQASVDRAWFAITRFYSNRRKAINKLARKHLKVSRQRKDFAVKTARALIQSSDLVVYENLKVKNMVKNHHLAKSISDASWSIFVEWLEYFAKIYSVPIRAVAPHYTSQDCSGCGNRVKKTLSTRTHKCSCGLELHRDHNAALQILAKGLNTDGQSGINAWGQNALYPRLETVMDKVAG